MARLEFGSVLEGGAVVDKGGVVGVGAPDDDGDVVFEDLREVGYGHVDEG